MYSSQRGIYISQQHTPNNNNNKIKQNIKDINDNSNYFPVSISARHYDYIYYNQVIL